MFVYSALPFLRIPGTVINCINDDLFSFDLIKNLVGKPFHQRASHLLINHGELFRFFLYRGNAFVQLSQEVVTKFQIPFVVPLDGVLPSRSASGVSRAFTSFFCEDDHALRTMVLLPTYRFDVRAFAGPIPDVA